jgi:hypothetical protein
VAASALGLSLLAFSPAEAQLPTDPVDVVTGLVSNGFSGGQLVVGAQVFSTDSNSTQEELPGAGHKFELLGGMVDDKDPENPTNDTISIDTTGGVIGLAFRNLPPGIKIAALNNQLGFKYFFVDRSCGGGSPRITLLVDADGDGEFDQEAGSDFAAHGHIASFTGCPPGKWVYENLTDELNRWEVTPGGRAGIVGYVPWDVLQDAVMAIGTHKVLAGFLLDGESCSFPFPPGCGKAHYDLVTIENRTLEQDQDTVKDR